MPPSTQRRWLPSRRQGVFLLSIVLPLLVFTLLGARLIEQERQLARYAAATGEFSVRPLQAAFFLSALFLALSVTLYTRYLLWQDMQRERRLADLQRQFVASVSHELRTPLASIRLSAETLLANRRDDPERRRTHLDSILHQSERLTRLVENILYFARSEEGRQPTRRVPLDLRHITQEAVRALQGTVEAADFTVHLDAGEHPLPLCGDPDALEQVLVNLLGNALKYSGPRRDIHIRLQALNDEAHIAVTDHGIGIAPAEQQRIFDKFYRVASSENEVLAGTGLGLTIALHIVAAHGGRIDVNSRLNEGSTFTIRLPITTSCP